MLRWIRIFVCLVLINSVATNSFAAGAAAFGNEAISARVDGQGGIGVAAQSEDPGVAYLNPAGLTKLEGLQIGAGFAWENLHGVYRDDAGHASKMRSIDGLVPNLAMTYRLLDGKLGTGLAVESPYGLESHWAGDSPLRYIATNSKLHMVDISPAIGYQVCPVLSLGGGADYYNVFDAALEHHVNVNNANLAIWQNSQAGPMPLPFPALGAGDANSRLSGTGTNWGYHLGMLVEPNEHHAFGLTYHSKVKLTINGTVSLTGLSGYASNVFGGSNYATAGYTDLYLPQNVQLGYAYKPNSRWMLEADTGWYDWNSNKEINVRFAETDATRLSLLSSGNPTPLNRKSGWSALAGVNYKQSDRLQWRGGFFYLPNATPESTFSPSVLDLDRYGLSVGSGIRLSSCLTLDVGYTVTFEHNRAIHNNLGPYSTGDGTQTVNGSYGNLAQLIVMGLTFRTK